MRVDRFLVARFPQLAFTHIQRIVRKGELRIDGSRAKPNERLEAGQKVRIPPLKLDQPRPVARSAAKDQDDRAFLQLDHALRGQGRARSSTSPWGLPCRAVRARSAMWTGFSNACATTEGQKPRLVHRLDKDTAGLPRHRQDALCRLDHGEVLPVARHAKDLLGARRRRAARAPGPGVDLSRQGGGERGRFPHESRAPRRRRARATR